MATKRVQVHAGKPRTSTTVRLRVEGAHHLKGTFGEWFKPQKVVLYFQGRTLVDVVVESNGGVGKTWRLQYGNVKPMPRWLRLIIEDHRPRTFNFPKIYV